MFKIRLRIPDTEQCFVNSVMLLQWEQLDFEIKLESNSDDF